MATFNSSATILNNCVKSTEALQSNAAFFVPSPSPLLGINSSSFAATTSAIENQSYIGIQKNLPNLTHHVNSSSSYTFMEIKREPCQVSEVTTSNSYQSSNQYNSKSMSSTMTTMVKIESTSPKISEMEKVVSQMNTNSSVPVGIAVARKRPQETALHTSALQPPRDMNYFGIRVADIGGVATSGCGNIYFAGADLISGASTEDMNSSIHNVNRSAPTFWQYPNSFPIDSVISMSPVGLQYPRDPTRGQLVLLPATTAMDSFQQAAFLWPQYMQQNPTGTLQSSPGFIFPSMSPQSNAQSQQFAAPLLLGSNYLTAAAAATSTLCQHSQANGSRFISVSSDTKRIDQSQKHASMKIEDWNIENNILNKGSLIPHHLATSRVEKSKAENDSSFIEMHSSPNIIDPIPMMSVEPSHNLLHNTPSPSEIESIPIRASSFMLSPDVTPLTLPQIGHDVTVKIPSFQKTPEMQDVNIQTDTPFCSEDENSSLSLVTSENMSCGGAQSVERNKVIYNMTSTQCHNNYGSCKVVLRENSFESLQVYPSNVEYNKESGSERAVYENDFSTSNRSLNKSECLGSESSIGLPNGDCDENLILKETNNVLLEMSGLELLSNISTGSFANHDSLKNVRVKQEPCESVENDHLNEIKNFDAYTLNQDNVNIQYPNIVPESEVHNTINSSTQSNETSLGGLNLLCALAEQRIQEEVEKNKNEVTTTEQNCEVKRRKHKHSKSKSSKKSRYCKKNKQRYVRERKEYLKDLKTDSDNVHENFKSAFRKVDPNCKKINKWPNTEEFFKAMESDMRMRLADITRQYRKKKRKLDEISKIKKRKKNPSSEYKFANISCKNPNFICFLDKFQSTSSNFPPPTEACQGQHIPTHNNNSECSVETSEKHVEVVFSDEVSPLKFKSKTQSHSSMLTEKSYTKKCKEMTKRKEPAIMERKSVRNRLSTLESQQKPLMSKAENKIGIEIDKELLLSTEHLYQKETRVLTDMGGLFYAGILKPLQPPDVYAITLDGERGNKSHIMSREEIFKDTILEVIPKKIENVPTGTRLCAYWSQQYRCLYPGKAIESENSDIGSDFVSVEFDDGDSGRIRLQNIRFLLSNYPIVEYNENPLTALGKNKKSANIKSISTDTICKAPIIEEARVSAIHEPRYGSFSYKTVKNKKKVDKKGISMTNLSDCSHKHRKHKKRKKHKKHHHRSPKFTNADSNSGHEDGENKLIKESEESNCNYNKIQNQRSCEKEIAPNNENNEQEIKNLIDVNLKSEASGLDEEDSVSNIISETSDEVNQNQKADYNSGKGSKIAAFLPERQLWRWLGQAYRKAGLKGRARKQFYKSITRGKEIITVGECAVFLSTGRPDRPYIGRIEAMWETTSSNKVVRVRWFYHPEETTGCPVLKYPGALFDSPHEDENDVQTISHRCEVIEFSMYIAKFGTDIRQYQTIYDNNDTYYLSGYYNPRLQVLKLQPDIPIEDRTSV